MIFVNIPMTYETLFRNLSLKTEGKGLVETLG